MSTRTHTADYNFGPAHHLRSKGRTERRSMLFIVTVACWSAADLARPVTQTPTERLSASPNIWLTHDFLSASAISHMVSKLPKDEAAYSPCIGQVDEFASKRCTYLAVAGDEIMEAALAKIETTWDVDTSRLRKGLPVIRNAI